MTPPTRQQQAIQAIAASLRALVAPESVIEIRVPKVDGKKRTDSGYFNDMDAAAAAAAKYNGRADGVYFTLNPVMTALLSRASNRIAEWAELTTSDDHIDRRIWLPVDVDPRVNKRKRPAGISSADEEHDAALARAAAIREWLSLQGWPEPVVADSGNGGALLYAIDLPNDAASTELVKRCLEALVVAFNDELCDIDTAVFNAARIWKVYGTVAGKGDSTEDRPHRRSAILSAPEQCAPVPLAYLQALARRVLPETERDTTDATRRSSMGDVRTYLEGHGIAIHNEKTMGDRAVYVLEECPFNADHRAPDSCVTRATNGKLGFHCFHDSCQGHTWKTLREKLEPGVYDEKPKAAAAPALVIVDGVAQCPVCATRIRRSKFTYAGTGEPGWYCPGCNTRAMRWPADAYTPVMNGIHAPTIGAVKEVGRPVELRPWQEQGVTLAELQHKQFAPEVWVIENILPEGACVFAAKYKSKKSWLSLALGCAVAMGGRALGRLHVEQGRVLYLDLEGKQQRIQKRTRAMLGVHNIPWPDNFHVFTKWPQGEAGLAQLEEWFKAYPDTRLCVVDVLNNFRRPMDKHDSFYDYDRTTVQPINELFEHYHAACLLVHHFNKAKGNSDVFDSLTGSTGLPSAVNTMWAFERDPNESALTKFSMRGRDLENDDPLALRWDDYLTQHIIEGPAAEVATSAERKEILRLLDDDIPRSPKEIAAEAGKTVAAIQQLLRKLVNEGLIDKQGYGKYARIRKHDQTDQSDQSRKSAQTDYSDRGGVNSDRGGSEFAARPNGVNPNSDRSDRFMVGGIVDRVRAAGWTQERGDDGRYRMAHPTLGTTQWYKVPFHAMSEADGISGPVNHTIPEGY